jgi:shikimate kinase
MFEGGVRRLRRARGAGMMKVVLIGYRAAGKSTVGPLLAACLGWRFLDTDRGIEAACGRSIRRIFQERGEPFFREVEGQVVAEMCAGGERVVAFGGGAILAGSNQAHAHRAGLVVYLSAPADVLWQRISGDAATATARPDLAAGGLEEVVTLLDARRPVYESHADLTLDATAAPAALVKRIAAAVRAGPAEAS